MVGGMEQASTLVDGIEDVDEATQSPLAQPLNMASGAEQDSVPEVASSEPPSDREDYDSAIEDVSNRTSTSTLASIFKSCEEKYFREYQEIKKYPLPNDKAEQDRLDFQHHVWRSKLMLGKLYLAPIVKGRVHTVLDVGTGTGIWAIEFCDKHPESVVYGVDISPIQPCNVPTNCFFQIDDLEGPWNFRYPFDYIHFGNSTFSFKNFDRVLESAYGSLKLGGWVEFQEMGPIRCKGVLADEINVWWNDVVEGAKRLGYDWEKANGCAALLQQKGFKNVRCKRETWRVGSWNCEPSKTITGRYLLELLATGLASLSLVPLIEGMGYTYGKAQRKIEDVKKALRDRNTLASVDTIVIYGQK